MRVSSRALLAAAPPAERVAAMVAPREWRVGERALCRYHGSAVVWVRGRVIGARRHVLADQDRKLGFNLMHADG